MLNLFQTKEMLLRLWYHESCRVFQDRLVNVEDRTWFSDQLENKIIEVFKVNFLWIMQEISLMNHIAQDL